MTTDYRQIVTTHRRVAVVGMSTDPAKSAHAVPAFLAEAGFDVVPVHPRAEEVLGRTAYPDLTAVPGPVEIVDVFRPAAEAPGIARQAVEVGAKVLWLQLGISSPEARRIAEDAGLTYVEDRCLGKTVAALGVTHDRSGGSR